MSGTVRRRDELAKWRDLACAATIAAMLLAVPALKWLVIVWNGGAR